MRAIDFVGNIKKNADRNLYLICGTERFLVDASMAALKAGIDLEPQDFNYTAFEKKAEDSALISACESIPMMASKRMVHLKDFDILKQGDAIAFVNYLEKLPRSTVVVFTLNDKPDKRKKLYKAIQRCGIVVEADPMQKDALSGWIAHSFMQKKRKIGRKECELLMEISGQDMYQLKNEIDKLCVVCEEIIDEKTIRQVCARSLDYNAFLLHELLIARNTKKAFELLREIIESEKTVLPLLALTANKFRLLYMARSCLEAGYAKARAAQSIAAQASVHPYAAKVAVEQCQKFELAGLIHSIELLSEYDYKLKSGMIGANQGIEELLLEIYAIF